MVEKDEIKYLENLCKLQLSDEERSKIQKQLNVFLQEIDHIESIDTEGLEITYNVNSMKNSLREEKVWESLAREEVTKNTSQEQYGYFKILKVVD